MKMHSERFSRVVSTVDRHNFRYNFGMSGQPSLPSVVVSGLSKEFDSAVGPLSVLRDVDLTLHAGDALAITGPSGSGKSTLLYIIGLLDTPTSGHVTIHGTEPHTSSPEQQAAFRNKSIGFIFQDHHLLPQCSVLENVLIPTLAGETSTDDQENRARALLEQVGLSDRITHRPAQLSGGERQRVAVCRALINRPRLLLADEPTGNLDHEASRAVGNLLLEVARSEKTTLICVTHNGELAASFPKQMQLQDGKLVDTNREQSASIDG